MYNYLTFLDDLQVNLNMFKSLPTSCIVFNGNGELIDINKAASDLLKIKDVECYTIRKQTLEISTFFNNIIKDIQNGKIIHNEKYELRCVDNTLKTINLSVSLFCEFKDVFIFQFTQTTTL